MEIFIRYMETYYKNMATCYLNGANMLSKWGKHAIQMGQTCYPNGANMLSKWGKTIAGETVYQRVRPSLLIYY